MKDNYIKIKDLLKAPTVFIYLLAAVLISLPMKFAFGSVACVLFLVVALTYFKSSRFRYDLALVLPIAYYFLMVLSLCWSQDFQASLTGLRKEIFLFFIPLVFSFIPRLDFKSVNKIIRLYSFAMALFGIYYFINAILTYLNNGDTSVFFYHQLVNFEPSAIYVSTFASLALFYFILIQKKTLLEQMATLILLVLVALLSSKTLLFIDFILLVCYYVFFSPMHNGIRTITVFVASLFFVLSLIFVNEIRERLVDQSQTAFVDNTVNNENIIISNQKIINVSPREAWEKQHFTEGNFFPGTALRIFQARIFVEMLQQNNIFLTGFGLDASQEKIKQKAQQYHLSKGYGEFNFHNQYIQSFAELGLFGLIILLAMLWITIKKAWRQKSFIHIVFAVTMIMLFLSESFLSRQRGVVFFITLYCLFNTSPEIKAEKNAKK